MSVAPPSRFAKIIHDLGHRTASLDAQGECDDLKAITDLASRTYRMRRRRRAIFGCDIFGEPAYDVLLDLYIALRAGRDVSVTSACVAADVPFSTALRHLEKLTAEGLIDRRSDPRDARRHYVMLTPKAVAAIEKSLRDW